METNKILSFEEFSTKSTTDTAVAEPTSTTDTTTDTEVTDTETSNVEDTEETTDSEETNTEETEEEETTEESENLEEAEEETKTVAEMMEAMKEAMKSEAKAYEADEYDEHTANKYLQENAALAAAVATKALEEMNEGDESYNKEAFEGTCKLLKDAYAKKIDEACEAYEAEGTTETEEVESPEKEAIIAEPVK